MLAKQKCPVCNKPCDVLIGISGPGVPEGKKRCMKCFEAALKDIRRTVRAATKRLEATDG